MARTEKTLLRAALLSGGGILWDRRGRVRMGIREDAFDGLDGDAPDFLRLAATHLAGMYATDAGVAVDREADEPTTATKPEDRFAAADGQLCWAPPGPEAGVPVVLAATSHLLEGLRRTALEMRRMGRTTMPVVDAGDVTYVGPLLEPEGSPCMACVQRQIAPNRQVDVLLNETDVDLATRTRLRRTALSAWGRYGSAVRDTILEVDDAGVVLVHHHVRSFEDCPVCGGGGVDRNVTPPPLRSVPSVPGSDTGSRVSHPDVAYAQLQNLVSPLTGAVRHVHEVDTGAAGLIHVYTAGHAVHLDSRSLRDFLRDGRDCSGGKGGSAAQARVSALCEALERFSAVYRGGEEDTRGSQAEVPGALDPADLLLFSEAQYSNRTVWNQTTTSAFQWVPEPFDQRAEVEWSRVWSLSSGTEAFVPTSMLYFGFRGPDARFGTADSNGLAAGQTLEEAVLQGFLELVERDAVALWWYNRTRHPAVDVGTFGDDYVERVFCHYENIGRRAWVLDLTSDLGIPVFVAISGRVGAAAPEIIFGFGAHLDPSIALRRCVTEMNQMLATVRRPPEARRGQLRGEFDDALKWWEEATFEEHAYLVPSGSSVGREQAAHGYEPSGDILGDVRACLEIARRHELEVYVRDMTRSDLGLPVVKVMAPGLRSFWRRLAPGRLYDAPVATGRLERRLSEAEMNPVSLFV